jgi:hypothetical protein
MPLRMGEVDVVIVMAAADQDAGMNR